MRLEWRDYPLDDGSALGPDDPIAFELRDLDADVTHTVPAAHDTVRRQGSVVQWRIALTGGFEGIALGKVVGSFADPNEAKKAVEEAVRAAHAKGGHVASKKTKATKTPKASSPKELDLDPAFGAGGPPEPFTDDERAELEALYPGRKAPKKSVAKKTIEDAIVGIAGSVPGVEVSIQGADGTRVSLTDAAEKITAARAGAKPELSDIDKLTADLAERLQVVVMKVEENFAPKLGEHETETYPPLDGEVKRERRSLTTKLSREEVEAYGHELAETVKKLTVIESLLDILRAGLRPTEKALTSRENALSGLVLRRERLDAVVCAHVLAPDASAVEVIRLDTGATIDRRLPKAGEGQTRMGGMS